MGKLKQILTTLLRFKKHFYAIAGVLFLFVIFKLFSFAASGHKEDEAYQEYFNSHYRIFSLNIPKDLNFSGEAVPLNDFSVREALDKELLINTYWQSQTLLIHKRANRWFPIIEPILKKNGIPDDFKYIAIVESGLTNIISPAKATGYWQIIDATGKGYGLEISEEVDERYNVERSTEAACKYFKEAYGMFKNWTLVAASYNMGMGGIDGQLSKQKVSSYYDMHLNEETSRYIFRILALKEIVSRPKSYGFYLRKKDFYSPIPTVEIKIDSAISDLTVFAISQGYNYKILKLFNPWLRKTNLSNPEKKIYTIVFPTKEFLDYNFESDASYDGNWDATETVAIDSSKTLAAADVIPVPSDDKLIHIVKEGETAASIALKYSVPEHKIIAWNNLFPDNPLTPGSKITIFLKSPQ